MNKFLELEHYRLENNGRIVLKKDDEKWIDHKLEELELDGLNNHQKAKTIQKFVSELVEFTPNRYKTISGIRESKNGNCYNHALMCLIFMRKAGIRSKFARELHLYRRTPDKWKDRKIEEDTHWAFGAFHNDHTWVLFYADGKWVPLDSSMKYTGYENFLTTRSKGVVPTEGQLMSPPFIIWSAEDDKFSKLVNITNLFLEELTLPQYWYDLMAYFSKFKYDSNRTEPLTIEERKKLKKAAFIYFNNPSFET